MRTRLSAASVGSEAVRRIEELSGEVLLSCNQCGKCSAGCPAASGMDMLPNQVMRFLQLGLVERVLHSSAPWLCAACQTCYARCPKGVDLSRVMEAVREVALQEGGDRVDPTSLSIEELSEFPQQLFIAAFRKYTE
jgi:heterodisulfide reductase subunit C